MKIWRKYGINVHLIMTLSLVVILSDNSAPIARKLEVRKKERKQNCNRPERMEKSEIFSEALHSTLIHLDYF